MKHFIPLQNTHSSQVHIEYFLGRPYIGPLNKSSQIQEDQNHTKYLL